MTGWGEETLSSSHLSRKTVGKGRELEGRTSRSGRPPPREHSAASRKELSRAGGWKTKAVTQILELGWVVQGWWGGIWGEGT